MNEVWIHGNDFSNENIHDDSGVRVVFYEQYQALEAERDRLREALGEIEVIRGNWQDGTLDDVEAFSEMSYWLSALYHNQALGGGDE